VINQEPIEGTPMWTIQAHLPVSESFGLTESLREATRGKAFPNLVFDHWQEMPGDPLEEGSAANALVE